MNHIKTLSLAGLFVTSGLSSSLAGTTGDYPGYSGQKKMAVILLNWSDRSCPGTRTVMVDRIWNNSDSLRRYYLDMSRNVLDFAPPAGSAPDGTVPATTTAVYGPYTLSIAAGFHQDVTYENADALYGGNRVSGVHSVARTLAAADGYNAANYDYIMYVTPKTDTTGGLGGYAGYNSNYSHMFDVRQNYINHEIGHNLYLSHSNDVVDVDGYGSQDCVMGNTANAHLDGPHSYQLGWYPDVCFPVKNHGQYDIENLAQPDTDNMKVLRFDRGAHGASTNPTYNLWIEYRVKNIGQDVGLSANWDKKVNIHYCEPRSWRPDDGVVLSEFFNNNVSKFAVGGSYTEPNNRCKVRFVRENSSNGSATVQLIDPGGNQPPDIPAQNHVVTTFGANFTVQVNDPENNPLTYTILSGPPVGTLTNAGSTFTYTGFATGTYSFSIRVNDGQYDSLDTAISMTVVDLMPPGDATAPATPDFATPPTAISSTGITMTASTVIDPSGVRYYFSETSGTPGGNDSGWQDSPTYTDTGLNPFATYSYTVMARDKSVALNTSAPSAALAATTQAVPAGGPAAPVIYEPFGQAGNATNDANLTGQAASVTGLTGNWVTSGDGSLRVASGSLSYGSLATSGKSLRNTNRRQGNRAVINSALSNAGLLAHGGVLWFSLIHKIGPANNDNAYWGFALSTDGMGYGDPNSTPTGVGFRISNTDQLTSAVWTPVAAPNITAGPAVDIAPNGTEFGSTVLIVGKVTWGADGTAPDTVDLYLPDTSLNLGSVKSTVSAIINQSTLDNIVFASSVNSPGVDYYNIDEIRFGARYLDVSPVPVVEPTVVSYNPADGASNVSPATDLVATFSKTIALTGLGTVTIVDTDNGSDTRTIILPDPSVSASGTTLTINPATNLAIGKNYAVQITANAVTDVNAEPFTGILNTTIWNFQVPAAVLTPPYDNWATGTEPFGGDANGDGVADGMAWILGAASPSANAHDKLPVPAKDGSFLTLNFKRVNAYSPSKLYVQYGNNLSGWTEHEIPASSNPDIGAGIEVVVDDLPNPDEVTVKVPTTLQSPAGALFVRLRAARN